MQANGEPTPLIGVVSLKLPPFWPADPALWFAHVESLFATRGISSQVTKFHYAVSALSPSEAAEVRDIIMTPPTDVPYDRLKHELVKRTTASEQRRLRQLLTEEELGDRKPSQLLRRMRQLIGTAAIDDSILRELFLQRLPSNARMILTTSTGVSLDAMAELADKILENASSTVDSPTLAITALTSQDTQLQRLQAQVDRLTLLITENLHEPRPRRPIHRSRSRPRRNSHSRERGDTTCWYHTQFGTQARNCYPPCSFAGNSPSNN